MKLYAVRVFVRKWDDACQFYRDRLGLPERFRNNELGWAEFDLGGPCLGVERVDAEDRDAANLVGRFVGVSLQTEDIETAYSRLRENGVRFRAPPEQQPWGGKLAHFVDPDDNVLTLLG